MKSVPSKFKSDHSSFLTSHMSLITNLVATLIYGLSFITPVYSKELSSIGLFALSGALTNWIAVHMLFEKVPGLYGSGVIVIKFEAFKAAIHRLIMTEFFNIKHLESSFSIEELGEKTIGEELQNFLGRLNYEELYEKLLVALLESPVGPMLAMVGGAKILEPAKPFFLETMKENIKVLAYQATKDATLKQSLKKIFSSENLIQKIESVILARLNELTPVMVKAIVASIIKEHLGWLVVWGGVFGGLIGLFAAFL